MQLRTAPTWAGEAEECLRESQASLAVSSSSFCDVGFRADPGGNLKCAPSNLCCLRRAIAILLVRTVERCQHLARDVLLMICFAFATAPQV